MKMKKLAVLSMALVGFMLMTGCQKHVAPTLTLMNGEGYLTENSEVYIYQQAKIGFTATGQKLTHFDVTITQNGELVSAYPLNFDPVDAYTDSVFVSIDVVGTVTVTCTVSDAESQYASKSFNVVCVESPNIKFLGHYEGNALATGTYTAEISGMDPMDQEFNDREIPVVLDLDDAQNLTDIYGHCLINNKTLYCRGSVEGNTVTFEAINDTVSFSIPNYPVSVPLNVAYTIKGTLSDGKLRLDGSCTGSGDVNLFIYSGTINLNATVGGSLEKTR